MHVQWEKSLFFFRRKQCNAFCTSLSSSDMCMFWDMTGMVFQKYEQDLTCWPLNWIKKQDWMNLGFVDALVWLSLGLYVEGCHRSHFDYCLHAFLAFYEDAAQVCVERLACCEVSPEHASAFSLNDISYKQYYITLHVEKWADFKKGIWHGDKHTQKRKTQMRKSESQ